MGKEAVAERLYEREAVGGATVRLCVRSYPTEELPPAELVRSVRCVVLRGSEVLALRREDRAHVLPGGWREEGETLARTLERELLEETGWTVAAPRVIGTVWLRSEGPRTPEWPAGSRFYPEFLWLVHAAEAKEWRPEAAVVEEDEGTPVWLPVGSAGTDKVLGRSAWAVENGVFLREAVRVLRRDA